MINNVLVIICAAQLMLIATASAAQQWPFDRSPYVYVGIEAQVKASNSGVGIFCKGNSIDTAKFGLGQVLYSNDTYSIATEWTHHSCISQYHDKNIYDAVGVTLRANLW